jgi:hypothetical protein
VDLGPTSPLSSFVADEVLGFRAFVGSRAESPDSGAATAPALAPPSSSSPSPVRPPVATEVVVEEAPLSEVEAPLAARMLGFAQSQCLPSQPLVVPGVIYHLVSATPSSTPAPPSGAPGAGGVGASSRSLLTPLAGGGVGSVGTSRRALAPSAHAPLSPRLTRALHRLAASSSAHLVVSGALPPDDDAAAGASVAAAVAATSARAVIDGSELGAVEEAAAAGAVSPDPSPAPRGAAASVPCRVCVVPPRRFAAIAVAPAMLDDHDVHTLHAAVCAVMAAQERGGGGGQ